jgi:serine/threonine-protein kinase
VLRIGETIDRYRIEALIGQGGMAAVYKARHLTLESEHAIKVLFITAPLVRARLLREGRVQAQLRHPNIVSVTDVLEVQGAPALVMEFIDGPPLDAWLAENKPNLDQALWLFRGILRGISAAHERGVVHRDLKPANVLLAPRAEGFVPKVTDFGLVKSIAEQQVDGHTQTGMSLGTPEYMSPEQIRDASDTDQRADMWALGCILYELVCHRRAFSGPDKMSTFNAIVAGTYPPIEATGLHDTVAEAIGQLIVVDREKRLASTDALFQVLYEESEPRLGRLSPPPKPVEPLLVSGPLRSGTTPRAASPPPVPKPPGGLGEGPTGRPAQQREAAPVEGRAESPLSGRDTQELRYPTSGRSRLRIAAVSVAAALALVLAAGWWLRPAEAPEPAATRDPLTAPGTPEPTSNATTAPLPLPVPETTTPRPTVSPKPAPTAAKRASITFSGDAKSVWLESGGRRIEPGPSVAPGRYNVVADFGDPQPTQAGTVDLREGESEHLTCNAFIMKCAPPN